MAWGLAEFDAEQRGKKEGYSQGVSDGEYQAKIETAKNMLLYGDSVEKIVFPDSLEVLVIEEEEKTTIESVESTEETSVESETATELFSDDILSSDI